MRLSPASRSHASGHTLVVRTLNPRNRCSWNRQAGAAHKPGPRARGQGPNEIAPRRGMHYIRTADGLEELYMLNIDPEERFNLAGSIRFGEALRKFRDMLAAMRDRE